MLKEYDGGEMNQAEALWNIARELSRRNDLLEIDMLYKTAEALRVVARSSFGDARYGGFIRAAELTCAAHDRISAMCGIPKAVSDDEGDDGDDEEEEP